MKPWSPLAFVSATPDASNTKSHDSSLAADQRSSSRKSDAARMKRMRTEDLGRGGRAAFARQCASSFEHGAERHAQSTPKSRSTIGS